MVERGHQPIVDGLAKMTDGGRYRWVRNLPAILWVDGTIVKRTTGVSPYSFNYGNDAVLPIELANPTWQVLDWERAQSTAELLALRARQLQRRDEDLEETALFMGRMRESQKELFDDGHRIRLAPFAIDDLVLLHDTKLEKSYSHKLTFRWLGPFRIAEVNAEKGTYILKELDESIMKETVNGSRLRRFHTRTELDASNSEFAADAGREDMDEDESINGRVEQRLRLRRRSDRPAVEEVILPSIDHGFSIVVPPYATGSATGLHLYFLGTGSQSRGVEDIRHPLSLPSPLATAGYYTFAYIYLPSSRRIVELPIKIYFIYIPHYQVLLRRIVSADTSYHVVAGALYHSPHLHTTPRSHMSTKAPLAPPTDPGRTLSNPKALRETALSVPR